MNDYFPVCLASYWSLRRTAAVQPRESLKWVQKYYSLFFAFLTVPATSCGSTANAITQPHTCRSLSRKRRRAKITSQKKLTDLMKMQILHLIIFRSTRQTLRQYLSHALGNVISIRGGASEISMQSKPQQLHYPKRDLDKLIPPLNTVDTHLFWRAQGLSVPSYQHPAELWWTPYLHNADL